MLNRLTARRNNGRRGQALAEFALTAPIFFLLLFGVIQLGLLFSAQNGLVNGARDTARRAATYRVNDVSLTTTVIDGVCNVVVDANDSELMARLRREIPGFVAGNVLTQGDPLAAGGTVPPRLRYEWVANNDSPTTYFLVAHVTVYYAHPLYVPLISFFLDGLDGASDGVFVLSASEQMRVENPDLDTLGSDEDC